VDAPSTLLPIRLIQLCPTKTGTEHKRRKKEHKKHKKWAVFDCILVPFVLLVFRPRLLVGQKLKQLDKRKVASG